MKKLPKEKRDQLVLVIMSTVALIALIYFGFIRPQYGAISGIQKSITSAQTKLLNIESSIKQDVETQNKLFDIKQTLKNAEDDMAFGDTYAWTVDFVGHYKVPYKVDVTVGQPTPPTPVDLLANFPYAQLKFNVTGTANYYELGKFIADMENKFPHVRVVNLTLEPTGGIGDDFEKLTFRMDIIALIKPK
jgi:hypothetical protein